MRFRNSLFAFLVLLAAQANAADDAWTVHGQVLDPQGKPAAGVDVAVFWNCNGIPLTEIRRIEKEQAQGHKPDTSKLDAVEGPMEPWGLAHHKDRCRRPFRLANDAGPILSRRHRQTAPTRRTHPQPSDRREFHCDDQARAARPPARPVAHRRDEPSARSFRHRRPHSGERGVSIGQPSGGRVLVAQTARSTSRCRRASTSSKVTATWATAGTTWLRIVRSSYLPARATSTREPSNSRRINRAAGTALRKPRPRAPGPTSTRQSSMASPPPSGTPPTRTAFPKTPSSPISKANGCSRTSGARGAIRAWAGKFRP